MKYISPGQLLALSSSTRETVFKVEIVRTNVNPNVVTDITDRVISVEVEDDFERRNATCSLTIENTDYLYTPQNITSPVNLVNGSYNPLIYPGRQINVYMGFRTQDGDEMWRVFTGILGDEINTEAIPGQIHCTIRDMSKKLQDIYIFLSGSYDNMLAEDVIQGLLNEFQSGISLSVQQPTNYIIKHYQVKDTNLWEAIQQVADLMGWVLRFDSNGVLILYPSKRDQQVADVVFDEDEIVRESLSISDADVRNDIWVKIATSDSDVIIARSVNQESINEFGRRYMEVDRSFSNTLSTFEQAKQLADAICKDLSWLKGTDSIEIPLAPYIETGDIVGIDSPKVGLDSSLELFKVSSLTHSYSADNKRTNLVLSVHKPMSFTVGKIPSAPTNLSATPFVWRTIFVDTYSGFDSMYIGKRLQISAVHLHWTAPTTYSDGTQMNDLYSYTIERSLDNVTFIPIGSIRAKDTSGNPVVDFYDYYVNPLTTYYYRVKAIRSDGAVSTPSSSVSILVPPHNILT